MSYTEYLSLHNLHDGPFLQLFYVCRHQSPDIYYFYFEHWV